MRSLAVALALVVISCPFSGAGSGDGDGDSDAGFDATAIDDAASVDAPTRCEDQWAPALLDPCDLPGINPAIDLAGGDVEYNTDTGVMTGPGSGTSTPTSVILDGLTPPVRVLFFADVDIPDGTTFRAIGGMPLLLASDDRIEIAGTVDVAADMTTTAAGSDPMACQVGGATNGQDGGGGAAGGGGGGFAGAGGGGGNGDSDGADTSGGDGGDAVAAPATPRGGCSGGRGGEGSAMDFGLGGAGGGAVQLSARHGITVSGIGAVKAGGGGGGGAQGDDCGGGGGGSGGYVRLDSVAINILETATVTANGGGGGGGSTGGATANGGPGGNASTTATGASGGGASGGSASPGASGAAGLSIDGATQTLSAVGGAGGGGGAAGFVLIPAGFTSDVTAVISPAAIEPP